MVNNEVTKLLRKIQRAWDEVEAFLAALTNEQQTLPTDAGGWAVKDHLMHMAVWEDGIDALLNHESRDARMGFDDSSPKPRGLDNINEAIYKRHRDQTLQQIIDTRRTIHDRFLVTLQAMTDDDLKRPIRDFEQASSSNQPIEGLVVGNTLAHYRKHLRWMEVIVAGE